MWEIMLPWIKDHGASWNWFKVYYASFAALKNGDFERSSMLKKKADAVQRALQMTWSKSWIPGASAFARDRMAELKAAVADRNSSGMLELGSSRCLNLTAEFKFEKNRFKPSKWPFVHI